ncbi:MAG: DUF5119 domain-containing protein [Muribaculaceae bacterium]|nr:DUF5119 domain-containing protein [Muribaculaceae bacterium]
MSRKAKILSLFSVLIMAIFISSCIHRPLEDPFTAHYIRIYIDEHIKNVTYGFYDESREKPVHKRPKVLRVALSDPYSGRIVSERYLQSTGEDERGYYIDGYLVAEPGDYNLLVYNFDTQKTKIRSENNYFDMQGYTNPVSDNYYKYFPTSRQELDDQAIRNCPEHLYVTSEPIHINDLFLGIDTIRNSQGDHFTAKSVVLSYYIQVKIKGFEYVSTAVSLMSGMAGSKTLYNREMNEKDPSSIFFNLKYTEVGQSKGPKGENTKTAVLYTTFNTFGKLPKEDNIYMLNFEFTRADGTSQTEVFDITKMFDEPLVKYEQWILLEKEIEITPSGSSGTVDPGINDWDNVWSDIYL